MVKFISWLTLVISTAIKGAKTTYICIKKKLNLDKKEDTISNNYGEPQKQFFQKNDKIERLNKEATPPNISLNELQFKLKVEENETDNYKTKWNELKLKLNEASIALEQCKEKLKKSQDELVVTANEATDFKNKWNEASIALEQCEEKLKKSQDELIVTADETTDFKNKWNEASIALEQCEAKLKKSQYELVVTADEATDFKNKWNEASIALKQSEEKFFKVQEELEEAEEEVASYKKKWNDQKLKLNETSIALDQCEAKLKKVQQDLSNKESDLTEQKENLSKKKEILNFINEILVAKEADNKDIKEHNAKIDNVRNFVENDLCDVFKEIKILSSDEVNTYKLKIGQWANLQQKTWLQKKNVISFIGEFSAGKTSIINRILSNDDNKAPKLPVSSKATTAIATYISHAFDFKSQFTDPSGKLKNIKEATFEKVNKEILAEAHVSSLIQYFVISYNNKNLETLSILDTPGFNSNDKEDTKRTSEVISEADALFWVFDVNVGEINQTSIDTIRDNLKGLPLYIVINKTDTKSPGELNKLETHIKETIRKNNITVKSYIRFHQKEPIDNLMNIINNIPRNDTKNIFIPDLYKKVKEKISEFNADCSCKEKEYRNLEEKNEKYIKELSDCSDAIENKCLDVKEMPELKEKFFTSDYYKITKEEYSNFNKNLKEIENEKNKIKPKCEKLRENSTMLQAKKEEWDKAKENRRKLEDLKKRFDTHLKEWYPNLSK